MSYILTDCADHIVCSLKHCETTHTFKEYVKKLYEPKFLDNKKLSEVQTSSIQQLVPQSDAWQIAVSFTSSNPLD